MAKSSLAAALLLVLTACSAPVEKAPVFTGPLTAGTLTEPRSSEVSGLAASRRAPGILWAHEDSGGEPVLHAIAADGTPRGQIRLRGVENVDWEDVASFEMDGQAWLCVADVGDNFARRSFVRLHFVPEPALADFEGRGELTLAPSFTLRVAYEDGPRDCESVAIDPRERAVYLLSKREPVPRLYRLPLEKPDGAVAVARKVGEVPHLPRPNALQLALPIPTGAYRACPCAMDFAADGSGAIVLTYGDTLYFPRRTGESWATALSRPPLVLGAHDLPQAEAACFDSSGRSVFVASEDEMRLLRYDRR